MNHPVGTRLSETYSRLDVGLVHEAKLIWSFSLAIGTDISSLPQVPFGGSKRICPLFNAPMGTLASMWHMESCPPIAVMKYAEDAHCFERLLESLPSSVPSSRNLLSIGYYERASLIVYTL